MMETGHFPGTRLRRLRGSANLRELVKETSLHPSKLILPLFIRYGSGIKHPISSMPGHFQLSVDQVEDEITSLWELGIKSVIVFGIPEHKDP